MKLSKKKIAKNVKEIQRNIDHYKVSGRMADIMLDLGYEGFEFVGHGMDLTTGKEDFSFNQKISPNLTVTVSTNRKKILNVLLSDKNDDIILDMKNLDNLMSVLFAIDELL